METGTLIDIGPTPPAPPARTSNGGSQEVLSKAAEQMKQLSIGAEVHPGPTKNGPAVKDTQPKPSPRGTTAPGSAKAPATKPKTPSSATPVQTKPRTSKQTNGDSPTKTTPSSAAARKAGSPATTPTTATARSRPAASPTTNPVALARAAASARKPSASTSSQNSPAANAGSGDAGEVKKLPMNKITVGTTPSPNIKEVKSKIGSLASATHRPGGGNVKISQAKLNWKAESKVGSLSNVNYQPSGGNVKVESKKVEVKVVTSRIGSFQNVKHKPGGGEKKIFDDKEYLKQVSPSSKTPSERGGSIPHSPTPREERSRTTSSSGGV